MSDENVDIRYFWEVHAILRSLFRLGKWHVEGQKNMPDDGPLIIATNHLSIFDPPLVMASSHVGPITVLVKSEFKNRFNPAGWILRFVPHIYVERGEIDRTALKQSLRVLKHGGRLGLAPEGTRSKIGGLQEGQGGTAYMALRTDSPVMPTATWGQEHIVSDILHGRRPEYWVRFGEPFHPDVNESASRREQIQQGTEQIMRRLAALLPPEYRGIYAPAVPHREKLSPMHTA